MTDDERAVYIEELRCRFISGEPRFDLGERYIERYEGEADSETRERILMALWNWSLSQPWAWDALVELCRRTPKFTRHENTAPLLIDFALMKASGERNRPDSGQGRNHGDINEKMNVYATVRVLVKDYGYKRTPAYDLVSQWCVETPGMTPRTPGAIRKIVTSLEQHQPFKRGRK